MFPPFLMCSLTSLYFLSLSILYIFLFSHPLCLLLFNCSLLFVLRLHKSISPSFSSPPLLSSLHFCSVPSLPFMSSSLPPHTFVLIFLSLFSRPPSVSTYLHYLSIFIHFLLSVLHLFFFPSSSSSSSFPINPCLISLSIFPYPSPPLSSCPSSITVHTFPFFHPYQPWQPAAASCPSPASMVEQVTCF